MSEEEVSKGVKWERSIVDRLLDRPYPENYLAEWTESVKQGKFDRLQEKPLPLFIFRLYNEWLALSVNVVKDVVAVKPLHSIPHRTDDLIKGTVNVGGHLKLLVSLANILQISADEEEEKRGKKGKSTPYMCLIGLGDNEWVIEVHEVLGIRRVLLSGLENVPVTVSKSTANFLQGIFRWKEMRVAYIEEELLLFNLRRRACD